MGIGARQFERRWEPSESVRDTLTLGLEDPRSPALVMEKSRTEVVALGSMWGPRRTSIWLAVHEDMHTEDGQGMRNEVVGVSVESFVGTDSRVWTIVAKVVNCNLGLRESLIPQVKGK